MKKLILSSVLMFAFFITLVAQNNPDADLPIDTSWISKGTKLKYSINFNQTNTEMEIELLSFYPKVMFKWSFAKPISTNGKVTILKKALDNSIKLSNDFNHSEVGYEDKTSMLFSRKFMENLRKSKIAFVDYGFGNTKFNLMEEQKYTVVFNGVKVNLPVLYLESDKGNKFWVLDNDAHPFIIKSSEMRFNVTLKEITPFKK